MADVVRIVKSFGRKISKDYSSWEFSTVLQSDYDKGELATKEKFLEASQKLFDQAKKLTDLDIKRYEAELAPQEKK